MGREIERTREGCREGGGNAVNVRLGEERATTRRQLERGAWSVESEEEIQMQMSVEQRWPDRSVISSEMDLTQR